MDEGYKDFGNVPVVWEPKKDSGRLTKIFMKKIEEKYCIKISDFWDLHKWSTENLEKFWRELWEESGIICSKPFYQVIDLTVPMGEYHEWFVGAKMNYGENLLKYRDNHVALVVAGEDRETEEVTYSEMYDEVKLYAAALRKQGVKKGDVVSCYMSNRKEAVFAMIAASSIGAVWVGVLPLMGPKAVLNRFSLVMPKILFTVDRFPQNKEEIDMLPKLKEIAKGCPSLEKTIIVASKPASKLKDISDIPNSCFLDDFLSTGRNSDGSVPEIMFEQVSFNHPVFISYTSGTTGLPKVLYHSSGILLSTFRDKRIQNNNEDRNSCWLSISPDIHSRGINTPECFVGYKVGPAALKVGWTTWHEFVSLLFLGIRVFLFEGVPYFVSPTFFWDIVDKYEISHLLLVPNVLDEMEKRGYAPTGKHRLSSLQFIQSGGSVVKAKYFDFVYNIKKDVIFVSAYGSTECAGVALYHDQTLKVHKCEIPAASLGVDCHSVDDSGKIVVGEVGEIVFTKPFPTLPLGLCGDTDRSLFKKTYCEKYPGMFSVGDLIIINPITKGIICCGRSDETLKPGGCRFGSSDIYAVVDNFSEIADSICVSQHSKDKTERAVLFLKMNKLYNFNGDLVERLKEAISKELSARHVPAVILETNDIPRNINGKKVEVIVKKIINKMPYNPETVSNPESLKNFIDLPELIGY